MFGNDHGRYSGAALAMASAALFGITTPAAKLFLQSTDPFVLVGLLYLGSGAGLLAFRLLKPSGGHDRRLSPPEIFWLGCAIFFGGVLAPILLMLGLARVAASSASLLLIFEGVATALMAWFVFGENFDRRIAFGMLAITIGAAILVWPTEAFSLGNMLGPVCIIGACLAWALDNNLTRKAALADPVQIAMFKGLIAGGVTLAAALLHGASLPELSGIGLVAGVGLLGYGVSLILFVLALRNIGAARTGAYFSIAPFIGAGFSLPMLGEPLTWQFVWACLFMAAGIWLHLTERHEHEHEHAPEEHDHSHVHDIHHLHDHGPDDPVGEPHSHKHRHAGLRHSHAHFPDSHHQHSH